MSILSTDCKDASHSSISLPKHLDKRIAEKQQKVQASSEWDTNRAILLSDLASNLLNQFEQQGHIPDLEQCITYCCEALNLYPASNPKHGDCKKNLAVTLSFRFSLLGQKGYLEEAITHL